MKKKEKKPVDTSKVSGGVDNKPNARQDSNCEHVIIKPKME